MRHARTERLALCDTLERTGPDAPTLSGSWTTADLAAHLVIRESRRLDLAAGIALPALADRTDRATRSMARSTPFEELVERVRTGPPLPHPARIPAVDEQMNLVEMFVHHEDVLRAGSGSDRRHLSPEMTTTLGRRLAVMAPMLLRKAGMPVEIVTKKLRKRVGSGDEGVEIHGAPGEVLLFAFGRQRVADVELVGPPAQVERLRTASLGI